MRRLGVDVEGIGSRLGENMLSKEDLVDQIVLDGICQEYFKGLFGA